MTTPFATAPLDLLDPQIDIVFKMLLLRHPTLLASMLEAVLAEPIANFAVRNPEISGELPTHKAIVVDILVELADGRRVNVEMQVRARPELRPRLVYYAARNLSEQLSRGDNYLQLRPSSVIVWLAEPLFDELDQFHATFELRERSTHLRYGEELTLHLLQLSKLTAHAATSDRYAQLAAFWGRFLSAKTALDFGELRAQDPIMSRAVDALEELSSDPEARRIATKRLIDEKFYEMGMAMARDEATKRGLAEGRAVGVAEGRAEGRSEGLAEGLATGEARGIAVGEASMLRRQLERKFGPLTDLVQTRLQTASAHDLERWGERILTANSVEEVFAE